MKIIQWNDQYIGDVVKLWNQFCEEDRVYKPFDEDEFQNTFSKNPHFSQKGTFIAIEDQEVIGFANGVYKKDFLSSETHENTPGYLTFLLVHRDYRRQGIGTKLLKKVETFLKENGKKEIKVVFFNPIQLEWFVSKKEGHDHPNAPGVLMDSQAYPFLISKGYIHKTKENSYYLPLKRFKLPEKVSDTVKLLTKKEIYIEYYHPKKHHGFNELFNALHNELWRKEIITEINQKEPKSILIANYHGKICGFTGPLSVQKSGRGYFAGIGVHPEYSGMGIGTALFFKLCEELKLKGASFMSLFTGENNPARKMYEAAGFSIVKSWATLIKELS